MSQVEITVVLDKSGSMYNQIDDTLGGFNSFVDEQRGVDNARLTLITFSNNIHTNYESVHVKEVQKLTQKSYKPSGGTALLDAIGTAIKKNDELCGDTKKMVVIITDGQENSSKKYTKAHVNDLISDRRARDWEFVFLAANQDAIETGQSYGIAPESALSFNQQGATQEAFEVAAQAVYRSVASQDKDTKVAFTPVQRQKSMGHQPIRTPPVVRPCNTAPSTINEGDVQSLHSNEDGSLYTSNSLEIPENPEPPRLVRQ